MAMKVSSQRVLGTMRKQTSRVAVRGFAADAKDAKSPKEEKREDSLMVRLANQIIEDNTTTVLPPHAREPSVGKAPIPYQAECSQVSGVGRFTAGRKMRVFMPPRHQAQSGIYNTHHWEIRPYNNSKVWESPLMGWTGTDDPLHAFVLKFDKKEEAIAVCERQGWEFEVEEPPAVTDTVGKISYSHKILPLHVENTLKTKGKEQGKVVFKHPTGKRSNWVKTLNYHGTDVVAQHGGEAKASGKK